MAKKVALVLSGGGAKGAFQFGAIQYIEEVIKKKFPHFDYSIIAGVSVGSLNGGMLAQNRYHELKSLWSTLTDDDVYEGKSTLAIIWRLLRGKKSALTNDPLRKQLQANFHLRDVDKKYDLRVGVVSLETGLYSVMKPSDFITDEEFRKAILASTSVPIVWEPVDEISLLGGRHLRNLVDGGLRNISPLGDVLDDNPTHVIIINCSAANLPSDSKATNTILDIANRSLADIAFNEIFNSDIDEFLTINRLAAQAKRKGVALVKENGKPYKVFKNVVIQPVKDLGDSLDFSHDTVIRRIQLGYEHAEQQFKGFAFR